jgi:hypothetical protein
MAGRLWRRPAPRLKAFPEIGAGGFEIDYKIAKLPVY